MHEDKGAMVSDDPFLAARRRRSGWRWITGLVLLAFVAGISIMAAVARYYPHWLPWAATDRAAAPQPVKASSAVPPMSPADYGALAAREAALAAKLSDLEARAAAIDSQAAAASGNATRAEALLVAFAARRALDRGLGLGYVEGQLRARFGATQPRAVAIVIAASRQPVTLEDLRLGLASIGPDLVSSDTGSWGSSIRNAFANLIAVHKAGTPSSRPNDRLTRARHLLEGGQVEAALAEVSQMPGASKAARWMTAAHRYVTARRALDVLETAAIIGQATQPPAQTTTPPAAASSTGETAAQPSANAAAPAAR